MKKFCLRTSPFSKRFQSTLSQKTPFISAQSRSQRPSVDDSSLIGMTGGEIFHEMMLRQNVKVVFGYPGGAILPVYDAIYNSDYFDFVLPRHEQGAGHMAEGYARTTGKPGKCDLESMYIA
jgi:acetolactate synthase I/II/III large subunit